MPEHKSVRMPRCWDIWGQNSRVSENLEVGIQLSEYRGVRMLRFSNKCHYYRPILFLKGTIEEKIYQRQISKQSLSGAVVDAKGQGGSVKFSLEDLRVRKIAGFFQHFLLE